VIKRADIKPSRAIQELLVDDPKDDGERLAGVLREVEFAGIRYPTRASSAAPKDMQEAVEHERLALQARYAAFLNRQLGQGAPVRLTIIDGRRKRRDGEPEDCDA
jgi:hypothetical protein